MTRACFGCGRVYWAVLGHFCEQRVKIGTICLGCGRVSEAVVRLSVNDDAPVPLAGNGAGA